MAICQAHKLPKTHLESVPGKGDRSPSSPLSLQAGQLSGRRVAKEHGTRKPGILMEARCEGAFLELAHAGEAREQGEVKRASYNQPNTTAP